MVQRNGPHFLYLIKSKMLSIEWHTIILWITKKKRTLRVNYGMPLIVGDILFPEMLKIWKKAILELMKCGNWRILTDWNKRSPPRRGPPGFIHYVLSLIIHMTSITASRITHKSSSPARISPLNADLYVQLYFIHLFYTYVLPFMC